MFTFFLLKFILYHGSYRQHEQTLNTTSHKKNSFHFIFHLKNIKGDVQEKKCK